MEWIASERGVCGRRSEPGKQISLEVNVYGSANIILESIGKNEKKTKNWDIIYVIYPKARLTVIIAHVLLHWWRSFIQIWEAGEDLQ